MFPKKGRDGGPGGKLGGSFLAQKHTRRRNAKNKSRNSGRPNLRRKPHSDIVRHRRWARDWRGSILPSSLGWHSADSEQLERQWPLCGAEWPNRTNQLKTQILQLSHNDKCNVKFKFLSSFFVFLRSGKWGNCLFLQWERWNVTEQLMI